MILIPFRNYRNYRNYRQYRIVERETECDMKCEVIYFRFCRNCIFEVADKRLVQLKTGQQINLQLYYLRNVSCTLKRDLYTNTYNTSFIYRKLYL